MKVTPYTDLIDMVRRQAESHGDKSAYVFLSDGEDREQHTSYAALEQRARGIGALLQQHDGNGCAKHALLLYTPGTDYILGYYGALFAGWTPVPTYPPNPARMARTLPRLLSLLADSQAGAILTTSAIKPLLEQALANHPSPPAIVVTDEAAHDAHDSWREPSRHNEIALLQYTSGSVAEPKGVLVSHANLLDNMARIASIGGDVRRTPRMVSWLPPYHDMGLIGAILYPIYAGGVAILMSPLHFVSRPFRWLRAVTRHQGNMAVGPNFGYQLCVRRIPPEDRDQLDLSTLEMACNGAEPIRADILREFSAYFRSCGFKERAFYPCYGLAESTLLVSGGAFGAMPIVRDFSAADLAQGRARPAETDAEPRATLVSVGRARGDAEIRVVDPDSSTPADDGMVGEIWARSPSVCRGYWQRSETTAAAFGARTSTGEGPYLRTGDLGFLFDGNLYITGRLKDLIIVRGRNVYPQDVERTCEEAHPSVRTGGGAAFSVDREGEERLVVAVEVAHIRAPDGGEGERARRGQLEQIVESVRLAISNRHELSVYDVLLLKAGAVPKTSSGKVQRHAARAGYLQGTLDVVYSGRLGGSR